MENNEQIAKIISDNLVYYRKKANLTQQELASQINYSDKSISKWERGDGTPDIFILAQLAKLYGLTVNDFLTTKKKEKVANLYVSKFYITIISIGLVWLVATLTFFILNLIGLPKLYLVYIYAIPVTFIVAIVFNDIFFKRIFNIIYVSGLIWTLATALYLTLVDFVPDISFLFIVPIPLQIIVILFYVMLYRRKRNK